MVGHDGNPLCQPCNEFHTLEECPYNPVEEEEILEHLNTSMSLMMVPHSTSCSVILNSKKKT